MSAVRFLTDLTPDAAHAAAVRAATALGFAVVARNHGQFLAATGSLARSILLPPTRPYCRFLVTVLPDGDRATKVILEQNAPWWMGLAGYQTVCDIFDELIDRTADAIETAGGEVLGQHDV
jgi:hypothetical protein